MEDESRPLVLTPAEALLAAETLRMEAKGAAPEFAAAQFSLFHRFALASRDEAATTVALTEADNRVLALALSYFGRIGPEPAGTTLQHKLTQLRIEFEVGDMGAVAIGPPVPTKEDVVSRLAAIPPWEWGHPRDPKGRFRRRE